MADRISDAVYEATEQERHRCEVEFAESKEDQWIKEHLAGVFEKRGQVAYNKLRNDILKRRGK